MEIEWREKYERIQSKIDEVQSIVTDLYQQKQDGEFLSKNFKKTLRVYVQEVKGLAGQKMNAYVQLYYDNQKYSTKTLSIPVWNEMFSLYWFWLL